MARWLARISGEDAKAECSVNYLLVHITIILEPQRSHEWDQNCLNLSSHVTVDLFVIYGLSVFDSTMKC